ncbi:MAG: hypothetical protein JF612_10140 [Planctomycetia bacterium]|nr:hypothetical protein [Planctomycetia bacterium]
MNRFLRFWYDFIIGDDWCIAAGVAISVALSALLAHRGLNAWWVMPVGVGATLVVSGWRAALGKP